VSQVSDASLSSLVEQALDSAKVLASEEAKLALAEADTEVAALRGAFRLFFAGALLGGATLSWAGVAVMLALGTGAAGVAVLAALGALSCAATLFAGWRAMPKPLFPRTRSRIDQRVAHVKESLS